MAHRAFQPSAGWSTRCRDASARDHDAQRRSGQGELGFAGAAARWGTELRQFVMLAFQVSILCMVFGFGLRAAPSDLLYLLRRPGLLWRSLLSVLVAPDWALICAHRTEHRHMTVS